MKRSSYTITLLLAALLLAAAGCRKGTLTLAPFDVLTPGSAFNSEEDLKLYTNSFYKIFPSANDIIRGDAMSDISVTKSVNAYLVPGGFSATQATGWSWSDLRNVNYFLQHFRQAKVPDDVKNNYEGIARFFRAWFYFSMVKKFGDVPWYSKPLEVGDSALYKPKDPRTLVMDSVLADLNYACDNIDATKDNTASLVTKWAALAFKSRVCLFEGTFRKYHTELQLTGTASQWLTEAVNAAQAVMTGNKYSIHKNASNPAASYRDLFINSTPSSDEIILSYVCSAALQVLNDANWYYTSATYGDRLSFNKTFINTYSNIDGTRFTEMPGYDTLSFPSEVKNRDLRLQQTIRMGNYKRSDGSAAPPDFTYTYTGYEPLKFTLDSKATDGVAKNDNSIPLIRYAEVLLNYAEARAELGPLDAADWNATIKPLRARAGLTNTDMPSTPDVYMNQNFFPDISDATLLEIRKERGIELALEGFRYDDLKRWNAGDLLKKQYLGLYVPAMNTLYDLNGDGKPDVSFVSSTPATKVSGVYYFIIDGSQAALSNGTSGNIIWLNNIARDWDTYKYFYPIPYNELVLNHNLVQNTGWDHP
ncbi:MAG TPA: RagB/SusD family nutrient uptake outer membrane protein [Puia sp.]|nr:RagB/SusD family nutrient uptake outer membrane protein [Puia sp.]